jgi:hypothetical protein
LKVDRSFGEINVQYFAAQKIEAQQAINIGTWGQGMGQDGKIISRFSQCVDFAETRRRGTYSTLLPVVI